MLGTESIFLRVSTTTVPLPLIAARSTFGGSEGGRGLSVKSDLKKTVLCLKCNNSVKNK